MTDAEEKLLASLQAIPPTTRAQAKAKLHELVLQIAPPKRRHANVDLTKHLYARHEADIAALQAAIDAIPVDEAPRIESTDPMFADCEGVVYGTSIAYAADSRPDAKSCCWLGCNGFIVNGHCSGTCPSGQSKGTP